MFDIPTFINSIEIDIDETDPLADVYQAVKEYFDSLLDEICNKTYIGMKRIQYPKDQLEKLITKSEMANYIQPAGSFFEETKASETIEIVEDQPQQYANWYNKRISNDENGSVPSSLIIPGLATKLFNHKDLVPYIMGIFYVFKNQCSSYIIAYNAQGSAITVPLASDMLIASTANVILANRMPNNPLVILVNSKEFQTLTIAPGLSFDQTTGNWLSDLRDYYLLNGLQFTIQQPVFNKSVSYITTSRVDLVLNCPIGRSWDVANNLLLLQGLDRAITMMTEREALEAEVCSPAIFIDSELPANIAATLFANHTSISPQLDLSTCFIYYCLSQLCLPEITAFSATVEKRFLSTESPDEQCLFRHIGRVPIVWNALLEIFSMKNIGALFKLSQFRNPITYRTCITLITHLATVEGLAFWPYLVTGVPFQNQLNLPELIDNSERLDPDQFNLNFYKLVRKFLSQHVSLEQNERNGQEHLLSFWDLLRRNFFDKISTKASNMEEILAYQDAACHILVQRYQAYYAVRIFKSSPVVPQKTRNTLDRLAQLGNLITLILVKFWLPDFGTKQYFKLQKNALNITAKDDPKWFSPDLLMTNAQTVLQVIFISLPISLICKFLPWFEEFKINGIQLTESVLLEKRTDITLLMVSLYCRLYCNLINNIVMLTNKDVGQLIPVLDCLHNKSSDAELQVTALIFILGHLPKVKGFFLIIFLCGLGPTSWKLKHFGLYLDSMERLDTEEMRFTAF